MSPLRRLYWSAAARSMKSKMRHLITQRLLQEAKRNLAPFGMTVQAFSDLMSFSRAGVLSRRVPTRHGAVAQGLPE